MTSVLLASQGQRRGEVAAPGQLGRGGYDLGDRRQRALAYEQVLSEGAAEDLRFFVDVDELIDLWDGPTARRGSPGWKNAVAWHCGTGVTGSAGGSLTSSNLTQA